ncbi:MAG: PqqD family protein [Ruminococcaceae bacterium]|nr:PqqD family protein [Oscillospiraceae bacterium]
MKLKKEFVTHELCDEQILVSASGTFSGYVKSNKTAAFIVDLLKNEISEEDIVNKLIEKYDVSKEIVSKDVKNVIATLRKIGAIDE